MSATVWLRASAVLTLLFCAAHTLGYPWVGHMSPDQLAQLSGIDTVKVVTQGFARSYSDFHKGFGLYISAMMLVQALVLWRLSVIWQSEPRTARFVTGILTGLFAATVVLDCCFFFWGPIIFSGVITLTLGAAFFAQANAPESGEGLAPGDLSS